MKVKQLISQLRELNPTDEVVFPPPSARIVERALAFTEAHNRYAVSKKNAYERRDKGRDSQMEIQILSSRRTAEMMHLFQECMTYKGGTTNEKGKAASPEPATIPPKPACDDVPGAAFKELSDRITQYLCVGGFFNPEAMDHNKVRNLFMDIRAALDLHLTGTAAPSVETQPPKSVIGGSAPEQGGGKTETVERFIRATLAWFDAPSRSRGMIEIDHEQKAAMQALVAERERAGGDTKI